MIPGSLALPTSRGRPGPGPVWALGPTMTTLQPHAEPCSCPTLTVPILTVSQTLGLSPSSEAKPDVDRALPPSH